jgi:hypothetical protein
MNHATAEKLADEWISDTEVRRRLTYSRTTLARLRKRGLPYIGRDRLRRYHWPTLLTWLSQRA